MTGVDGAAGNYTTTTSGTIPGGLGGVGYFGKSNYGSGGNGCTGVDVNGSGGGGGSGLYIEKLLSAPLDASYSVVIGAGGSAGAGSRAGSAGNNGRCIITEFYGI